MWRRLIDFVIRSERKRQTGRWSGADQDTGMEEVCICVRRSFGESGTPIIDSQPASKCFLVIVCCLSWRFSR